MNQSIPTEQDAKRITENTLGKKVKDVHRFPTGMFHYVYDVTTDEGEKLVVRLTLPKHREFFNAALHWYEYLQEKEVPLPQIYFSETDSDKYGFPVMIMERLNGTDLGNVYIQLTTEQKKVLARQIAEIQKKVGELPQGNGYGYALSYTDKNVKPAWTDVLLANLNRSKERIHIPDNGYIKKVKNAIHNHAHYFSQIKPLAFLDDTTTKNVIISPEGTLSGIVDFDSMAFGDALYALGLTRASLLSKRYDTDYTDFWEKDRNVSSDEKRAVRIYTALFAIDFLSEIGNTFNKEKAKNIDRNTIETLFRITKSSLDYK